jgi:hypothetical protein
LSQRRLARTEDVGARDETARSVLGNVVAMEHAVALGAGANLAADAKAYVAGLTAFREERLASVMWGAPRTDRAPRQRSHGTGSLKRWGGAHKSVRAELY